MAAKAGKMEVFPDIHHKMSKKIAQLTKVIYHLNTKNEVRLPAQDGVFYRANGSRDIRLTAVFD